ncbi:hypothetical protein ZIOFF_036238 [Zingiber officinale]|uniref:Uncharacterized protein n=1 Tax=Zingiber officinale TaxID=94328 RepID=A0A8J5GHX1_ZINOF|nr:hypothetical protein ZIOFF_036238 [Zingiber officinale]
MAKQNTNALVLCPSIALLQQRFKRLQKIKQMREKRQILRVLAEAAQQSGHFFSGDSIYPLRPPCGSPSIQLHYQYIVDCAELQPFEPSLTLGLWSDTVNYHASITHNDLEVDTSLHL